MTTDDDLTRENRRGRRRGRVLRVVTTVAVVGLAATVVKLAFFAPPGVGHWKDAEGRATYARAYAAALADMPAPTRTLDIPTRFGTVRALEWAAPEGAPSTPVVLLPGRAAGAPMWSENMGELLGHRTLYALDAVGDSGFSTQSVPLASYDDQAEWVAEAITGLGLTRVHTVGHSFGGATAAVHALRHPEQIASVSLLEPAFVIARPPLSLFLWSALIQLPGPQSWEDYALAKIGGTTVEEVRESSPVGDMIAAGAEHYTSRLPVPRTLTDDEWRAMPEGLRVDLGGRSDLAGGAKGANRIRALRPDAVVTLWPEATHSLPMQEHAALGPELVRFWDGRDTAR